MNPFETTVQFRWSDLDPNFHVRHSVYYDICAQLRTQALGAIGFSLEFFAKNKIGPVLFKEECAFRREIRFGDTIKVNVAALKLSKDGGRFSFVHEFTREGELCARLALLLQFAFERLDRPRSFGFGFFDCPFELGHCALEGVMSGLGPR